MFNRLMQAARCLLAIALLASAIPLTALVAKAAGNGETESQPVVTLRLSEERTIEITRVLLLPSEKGRLAEFTVRYVNNQSTPLSLYDYFIRLNSKSGSRFIIDPLPEDKDLKSIPPMSSATKTYYAYVSTDTTLQDLEFELVAWDLNAPNMEHSLDSAGVPDDYNPVAKAGVASLLNIGDQAASALVKRLYISKNETNVLATVFLELENRSPLTLNLPQLEFLILTPEGVLFNLNNTGFVKDIKLQPKESKERALTATIPVSNGTEGWKLVIARSFTPASTSNSSSSSAQTASPVTLPLALLELPQESKDDAVSGKTFTFTDKNGEYTAVLDEVQRLPWDDQDLLATRIRISNKSANTLPIPNFTGYLKLDDAVKVDAKFRFTDKIIGILPNSETSVYAVAPIPFSHKFSKLELTLQEKDTDGQTNDLLQISHDVKQFELQTIPVGTPYQIDRIGKKAEYKIAGVQTFKGDAADIVASLIEVSNLEKRSNKVSSLIAHLMLPDGSLYPVSLTEVKGKVNPGSKALLYASAAVRKDLPLEGAHLLIGEAVFPAASASNQEANDATTEGGDATTDGNAETTAESDATTADGYVNAVALALPAENQEVKTDLKGIRLEPYTIDISQIGTQVDFINKKLSVKLNYNLTKDPLIETNPSGHNLVIELEDANGLLSATKSFKIDTATGAPDDTLRYGSHSLEFTTVDDIIGKIHYLNKYKLKVYHQFRESRKLLAVRDLSWFVVED